MPKVSVLTVSIRPERLKLVEDSLSKQSFQSFEWVVETSKEKPKDYVWAFNRSMNKGIKRCKGNLIISIQDSIYFNHDALEKFYFYFQSNPKWCVSGVGDQYDRLDENDKPIHTVWLDPRRRTDQGSIYECNPEDWELNFCSFSKESIVNIGGFDEQMDEFYGMDNVSMAFRLDKIGSKFYLDQTNESFSLQHGRRNDWEDKYWLKHNFWEWFRKRPVKLDYLKTK